MANPSPRRVSWVKHDVDAVSEYVVDGSEDARALRHGAHAARRSSRMAAAELEGQSWKRANQREVALKLFDLSPRYDKLDSYIARYGTTVLSYNRQLALGLAKLQVSAQGPAYTPDCDKGLIEWQLVVQEDLDACARVDADMVRDGSRNTATGVLTLGGVELPPYAGLYTDVHASAHDARQQQKEANVAHGRPKVLEVLRANSGLLRILRAVLQHLGVHDAHNADVAELAKYVLNFHLLVQYAKRARTAVAGMRRPCSENRG